jgi:methylenetetrahydrofolate reductase (NADPH)
MRVDTLYGRGRPVVSFEFFPPATPQGEVALVRTIDALRPLAPGFVSITRTGTRPREAPVELATRIKALGIEGAAHMTCVRDTRAEIEALLALVVERGIENVVALRGDLPPDPAFRRPADGFTYATDLVAFIRARGYPLCVIGAGHPEGHPECRDLDLSIRHLRTKVDAGLDVVITQLFYDNRDYFAFVERARRAGIGIPIVAGIMPVTNWPQIERIARLSGNQVPAALRERLDRLRDDEAGAMAWESSGRRRSAPTSCGAAHPASTSTRSTDRRRRAPSSRRCDANVSSADARAAWPSGCRSGAHRLGARPWRIATSKPTCWASCAPSTRSRVARASRARPSASRVRCASSPVATTRIPSRSSTGPSSARTTPR